jgi:hypothetical protein
MGWYGPGQGEFLRNWACPDTYMTPQCAMGAGIGEGRVSSSGTGPAHVHTLSCSLLYEGFTWGDKKNKAVPRSLFKGFSKVPQSLFKDFY